MSLINANRDTAPAFFEGVPGHQEQMFGNHSKKTTYDFAGLVLDYNEETGIVTIDNVIISNQDMKWSSLDQK